MENRRNKIELLAPARTADIGIEAVLHGADAVYIGGPQFGARAAAGNSVADIARLVAVAHTYFAKVYVTLNTILTDAELLQAEPLIWQLYEAGVDAFIIQDLGITQLHLPPVPLHSSTQMDVRTPQKVQFLQQAGFDQVVLARELSLAEISAIASSTTVPLEVFVHGSICVCYNGQCYASCALTGRSANRGECAQICRLPFDLVDAEGHRLAHHEHLLSLKDMNQEASLPALIQAGVSSFKIEGRLKDEAYVKNVTAYYRRQLDVFLSMDNPYSRSSSGTSTFTFEPDVQRSFNRGFTSYFLNGRSAMDSRITPKSLGKPFGKVKAVGRDFIEVSSAEQANNGDGFCFVDEHNSFSGFKANRVEGARIFPLNMPPVKVGMPLNRNFDAAFTKLLSHPSAQRKIAASFSISSPEVNRFQLQLTDEDGLSFSQTFPFEAVLANNLQKSADTLVSQLSKTGNTPVLVAKVENLLTQPFFLPASVLADWRRTVVDGLLMVRTQKYPRRFRQFEQTSHPYLTQTLDYRGNVYNASARQFWAAHGVTKIEPAFEAGRQTEEVELMLCRYCIRFALGLCSKKGIGKEPRNITEPLFLVDPSSNRLRLQFDCKNCQMHVWGKMTVK